MEQFVVSARKYRPQTFKDVVGQQAITSTLQNAITNNHLAQALLFTGPRGVGKTTCARILAKMINSDGTETQQEDFAFNIFELDAASNNGVDHIRELTDQVRIPPQVGKYKVYIIDEVHMLSSAAFNAFLKTLEEPPKHCIFILATTEKHKIIPTILSRCQIFDFKRISIADAKEYLKYIAEEQGITAEDDALHIIAQKADGAMRDALSIFDRVVSFAGKNLTREAVSENLNVLDYETYFTSTNLILENKIPELLLQFNTIIAKGFDMHHYLIGLASHFRDLLVTKNQQTIALLEVGENAKKNYETQSKKTTTAFLLQAIELANTCDLQYNTSKNQRLHVELCLMQLASIAFDGEKKKNRFKIIPPSYFTNSKTKSLQLEENSTTKAATNSKASLKEKEPIVKPILDKSNRKISGLSLGSIQKKNEHIEKQSHANLEKEELPKNTFTQEDVLKVWNAYIKQLEEKGKHNLASILSIDTPKMEGTTLKVEFPNSTNKVELERAQVKFLPFLRNELKNYDITIEITVNENLQKKFAYTTAEKFKKLVEKNNAINRLKQEFDLEL